MEDFLSCPAILRDALLDADKLYEGYERDKPVANGQGYKRVLLPLWVVVNVLPPVGQGLHSQGIEV